MNHAIFQYSDYKTYLRDLSAARRGFRSRMAEAASCQNAFISQVLNGKRELSLEQAEATGRYLGHRPNEQKYFLLLVEYSRAGTESLRSFFSKQLQEVRDREFVLKDRIKSEKKLTNTEQSIYFSCWYFAAIHISISTSSAHTKTALAEQLKLPMKTVSEALAFLQSIGLIQDHKGHYSPTIKSLHLGTDSPFLKLHHVNWRLQAIEAINDGSEDLHYSSVISLSRQDALKVKRLLVQTIEQVKSEVRGTVPEQPLCFNLDFFEI